MSRRPAPLSPRRSGLLAAGAVAVALLLSSCAQPAPAPTTSSSAPEPTGSATPTEAPGPVFDADGTAADNLPIFTLVVETVWASEQRVQGRAYVDALVAAGFDKSAMQVTADTSTVGNPAESIQFSVRWGDECLIGQVGPATGEPVTIVMPGLDDGGCLIGDTRPIDW